VENSFLYPGISLLTLRDLTVIISAMCKQEFFGGIWCTALSQLICFADALGVPNRRNKVTTLLLF
jgi:hypothetical protein